LSTDQSLFPALKRGQQLDGSQESQVIS
jgi:hypothetical protein